MENYYEVHNICKMVNADEEFPFIELTTETDFQYYFYLNQQITLITDSGEKHKGVLSAIENTFYRLKKDNGEEIVVTYFETKIIIGKPDRE